MDFSKNKKSLTFRPKKRFRKGSKRHQLHQLAKETIHASNLREAVTLPDGESKEDWLAVNIVDFFNQILLIYGSIQQFCTKESCPVMSAGKKYEYLWMDNQKYKKPTKLSAPEYITELLDWVQDLLNNEQIFPTADQFPEDFFSIISQITKRLFRIYAHIYYSHPTELEQLGALGHTNACFKHFMYFVNEFNLIQKRELAPLEELINELFSKEPNQKKK
ncbi:mob kinase activator-like 1 [Anaeramoeba ignava]|uniref:Mob kinase activator-like 1 n=1 Tax=Anaeramoeba ignava TaxID=1746090 RepID=A0A9Q0LS95_ANAIG|nr:mob kinase activator-like 1 [Anaeramoeba ignava]